MQSLSSGEVAVWLRRTDALEAQHRVAIDALLSPDECARRDRFVFERDRRDFSAAHALLRTALACCGPLPASAWQFGVNPYGKPSLVETQLDETGLSFNLSHSHGLVACAIAKAPCVGIDLENADRIRDGLNLAGRLFTPGESRTIASCATDDAPVRFLELWTLKEAYIKAIGLGLSLSLDSFEFSFSAPTELRFERSADDRNWQFWLAAVSGSARLAVAVPRDDQCSPWRISFHDIGDNSASEVTLLRATGGCPTLIS